MSKIELDRNKTLYGQITDILRERIMSGEFKPGDILPSERELAEEMQVSRIPVREAMKSLEYLGVVKQIRGKGVLVQTADLSNILKVVGPLVTTITPQILLNLFDFRLAIEPYAGDSRLWPRLFPDYRRHCGHLWIGRGISIPSRKENIHSDALWHCHYLHCLLPVLVLIHSKKHNAGGPAGLPHIMTRLLLY